MPVGSPFAGRYSTFCRHSRAEDTEQPTQVLLNHYCLNVKGFTRPHVWVLEDCNTTRRLWDGTAAIQRAGFARSAGAFPKLPPLPHKNFFCPQLRTVACTMCFCVVHKSVGPSKVRKASAGNSIKQLKIRLAHLAHPLPVPYQKLWKSVLFLLIRRRFNTKHRQVMVRDSNKYISENSIWA